MGDLPMSRVNSTNRNPFEVSGADLFGPIGVKIGRSIHKRWIALFCCHVSRAIHLEKVDKLDSSSFINAVRRFQARRGHVRVIRLDNATNHVAANKETNAAINQWNQSDVGRALRQRGIQYQFNPPMASHVGGVFETCIRLCRRHLRHLLGEQRISDESLSTIITEVEFLVNSRPLYPNSDSPDDLVALTPNDLLVVKPMEGLPPGVFDDHDQYRKRWRQIQYMVDVFWRRYIREYLPLLHRRQKWIRPRRNTRVNDLVLLHDPNAPRGRWQLGRVLEAIPSPSDGLVRTVKVKTVSGTYTRPIQKTLLLEGVE